MGSVAHAFDPQGLDIAAAVAEAGGAALGRVVRARRRAPVITDRATDWRSPPRRATIAIAWAITVTAIAGS
jgi:hypothetical protein